MLAMAGIPYEFREAGLLTRIRKIKVLHTEGFYRHELLWPRNLVATIRAYDILQEYQDLSLDHLEYETQTSLFAPSHRTQSYWHVGDGLIEGLWFTPWWKRLSILDTGGCMSDTFVNIMIERIDNMRSENPEFVHSFDEMYELDLPGVSLVRNGKTIARIESSRPLPLLPPPCTMLCLRDLVPSWLGGPPAESVVVIERASHRYTTEEPLFDDSSIWMWYKNDQSQWKELRKLKRIVECEQWRGDRTGAIPHDFCRMGQQCRNLFECSRPHKSLVRVVV